MTYPLGNSPPDGQRIGSNSSEKREYEPSALGSLTLSTSSTVDDTEKNWPTGWRPYAALFGGFLLMFCAWGTVNFYGTFASYYSESLFRGDDMLLSNLVGSTQCFVVLFFSFIVGRLLDANHSRQLLLAGSVIITIGMFMLSISNGNGGLNQGNYGLTWLTQGLVTGLGMACFFVSR
ncbi:hypothetical protein AUEXF2481DRAFT_588050 [Aureobasidium subglaciale EXF-2481]|uniref:Major facilitator superfamily (MFS) profile domain-containing protein n=1 Tax=Aureobasidium subglaciale (strain EXF-2481) TaxID=1043005 RepID=A0A074YHK1_AURSE|nr:uncharacterized protein AUEXF2481DRAFT_588050 [Aureobasidium subglaciale EXF-2481]KEQ97293.1 hypothetical protein AUEXF2481DRAFT_588050 [Aureobasidium subglaciale EXF-2481]